MFHELIISLETSTIINNIRETRNEKDVPFEI